jgi:hypothetical protein
MPCFSATTLADTPRQSRRAGEHHADLAVFARFRTQSVQNVWQRLRQTLLSNRVLETSADIVDAA